MSPAVADPEAPPVLEKDDDRARGWPELVVDILCLFRIYKYALAGIAGVQWRIDLAKN